MSSQPLANTSEPDLYFVFNGMAFYLDRAWDLYAAPLAEGGAPEWGMALAVEHILDDPDGELIVSAQTAELADRTLRLALRIETEQAL